MIIAEMVGENLIKRYSGRNVMLQQTETGQYYAEAIDLITSTFHYIETEIPVESEEKQTVTLNLIPKFESEKIDWLSSH